MNNNIAFYKNLEGTLKHNLESQYTQHMINGEIPQAYNILGSLMKYKLISKFDERLSTKNKIFAKAGIDKEHRFPVDLRKDTNFIAEWIYADIPNEIKTTLIAREHIGERRDFGYLVDITLPERHLPVKISLLNTPISAKNEVEAFGQTFKAEMGKELNVKSLMEEAYEGCCRIYNIKIDTQVLEKYKNIGHVLVYRSLKDNRFKAKILLKSKALQYYFIDIRQALSLVKNIMTNSLNLGDQLDIGLMADYRKAILVQKEIIKKNNVRLHNMKNLQKNDIRTWEQVEEMEKNGNN